MSPVFQTVANEFRYEIDPIKGSRFLTTVAPASTPEEAEAFVQRIRAEFAGATHNCWAWRTGRAGEVFRSSDDGEPSGSAGRPILAQLEGHDVTNVAAVVTRWFGGTKLGVGGLMRAYGGACGQTLDRAPIRRVVITCRLTIEHSYELSNPIAALLAAWKLDAEDAEYGEAVRFTVTLPGDRAEDFRAELNERSGGRAMCAPFP